MASHGHDDDSRGRSRNERERELMESDIRKRRSGKREAKTLKERERRRRVSTKRRGQLGPGVGMRRILWIRTRMEWHEMKSGMGSCMRASQLVDHTRF